MRTRRADTTEQEKTRRVDRARLFLYLCLGVLIGLMLSSGRDYVLSAEKTTRVIEPVPTAVTARSAPEGTDAPEKLNLNTASYDDLLALPGIGPTYAQAILDYRAAHGPFHFIEEVMDVRGIGPKRFDAIKRLITCGD